MCLNSKNVLCLDTGADKDEALAPYFNSGAFWIEDKTENAELGAELGLQTSLVNSSDITDCNSLITRCANWAENLPTFLVRCLHPCRCLIPFLWQDVSILKKKKKS